MRHVKGLAGAALWVFLCGAMTQAQIVTVDIGRTVALDYTLFVDGQVMDSNGDEEPLEYIHGQGMIIAGLEAQLQGLAAGDEKTIVVSAQDGYGLADPQLVVELPQTVLSSDLNPEKGMTIELETEEGQMIPGVIEQMNEDMMTVNFNHPLAGKELTFEIKIVSIR